MDRAAPYETYPFPTLPDLLAHSLRVVFVGINPSIISVEHGHYFARKTNRFWPAFSRSRLGAPIVHALRVDQLGPEYDVELPRFGIGFTDVVKRPSSNTSQLERGELERWAPALRARLERFSPRVACFHGLTGYRPFARVTFGDPKANPHLGAQEHVLGTTRLFVVPNPSPANAHFTPADQAAWYDRLADFLDRLALSSNNAR